MLINEIGLYFRPDLVDVINKTSEEPDSKGARFTIENLKLIINRIAEIRPRFTSEQQVNLSARADYFYQEITNDAQNLVMHYNDGIKTIIEVFASMDVGKEEHDLLILTGMIQQMFRRAGLGLTADISENLFNRLEKYYYHLIDKDLRYQNKSTNIHTPMFNILDKKDLDTASRCARNTAFEKISEKICASSFIKFQETAFCI